MSISSCIATCRLRRPGRLARRASLASLFALAGLFLGLPLAAQEAMPAPVTPAPAATSLATSQTAGAGINLMLDAGAVANLGTLAEPDGYYAFGGLAGNASLLFDLDPHTSIGPSLGWLTYSTTSTNTMFFVPLTCDLRFKGEYLQGVLGLGPGFYNLNPATPLCLVAKAGLDVVLPVAQDVSLYLGPSLHAPMLVTIGDMALGVLGGIMFLHGQVHLGVSLRL